MLADLRPHFRATVESAADRMRGMCVAHPEHHLGQIFADSR